MNAEALRLVAAEIRANAEPMLGGAPWHDAHGAVRINGRSFEIAGRMGMLASAHIAAWHPAVALVIADWLDEEALRLDVVTATFGAGAQPSHWAAAFVKAWRGES